VSSIVVTSEPSVEPVSTADMKTHLRITHSDDDTYIAALVKAARIWCEEYQNRAYIFQTIELRLDEFPEGGGEIELPRPPLESVTSVKYIDTGGNTQTWDTANYTVDKYYHPARIVEAYSKSWVNTRDVINAVTVTYVAGYGSTANLVPASIVHAIKLIVSHWYEHREEVTDRTFKEVPLAAKALLDIDSRNYPCR